MSQITQSWLNERIAAIKLEIEAREVAFAALSSGAVVEYNLDTGQTVTKVKKADLTSLQLGTNALYNLLSALDMRANGGHVTQVMPAR